jgi:hypothetical protein
MPWIRSPHSSVFCHVWALTNGTPLGNRPIHVQVGGTQNHVRVSFGTEELPHVNLTRNHLARQSLPRHSRPHVRISGSGADLFFHANLPQYHLAPFGTARASLHVNLPRHHLAPCGTEEQTYSKAPTQDVPLQPTRRSTWCLPFCVIPTDIYKHMVLSL